MSQSIITNTVIATGGRLANMVLGVAALALITRLLGPGRFGFYIWLLSLGAIVQLVADLGLYLTLTREIAHRPAEKEKIFSSIASLRLLLLLVVMIAAILVISLLGNFKHLTVAFAVIAVGLIFQSLSQLLMGLFQYYQTVWRATIGDLLGRMAQILGIIWLNWYTVTVNAVAAMFTIGAVVAYLVHRWLLPQIKWRLQVDWPTWKKVAAVSWPLGAMLLVNAVYFRIDTLILSVFRSPAEVGWYGLAYHIVESTLFFPAMFGGLLLPRLSEAKLRRRQRQGSQYISEGITLLIIAAGYCLVVLPLFSYDIVVLVAGPAFSPAANLLTILSLALVVMFIGNLLGFALVAMEKQLLLLWCYVGLALGNTVANLALVPVYGARAAAWTTVVTELAATLGAAYYVFQFWRPAITFAWLARVIVISVATLVLLSWLPIGGLNVFGKLALATVLYGVLIYSSGTIYPGGMTLLASKS